MVFNNPENLLSSELEIIIKSKLIDETWFYAKDWNLPDLFFENSDFNIDPTWHEFVGIEYTDQHPQVIYKSNLF